MTKRTNGNEHNRNEQPRRKQGTRRREDSRREDPRRADSRKRAAASKAAKKKKSKRKLITILSIEAFLVVILLVGLWGMNKLNLIKDYSDNSNIAKNEDMSDATKELLSGYTTIALFGIDTREMGELGEGNRSDTIILASINNDTKEVRLASVYRDTYLNLANNEYGKCNAAYYYGGPDQAISMLNTNLDLDIEYYASVDFLALIKTINLLGGVDIDVADNEWEWVNAYMLETSYVTGENGVCLTGPGLQTLMGLEATAYCRIRAVGNDYGRTERQRKVIAEIINKAKGAKIGTIMDIIDEVFPLVATNIPKTEMLGMAASMMSYELGETCGFPMALETKRLTGGDTVVAKDLETNVTELHKFLFDEEDYYPSPTVIQYSKNISQETGIYAD